MRNYNQRESDMDNKKDVDKIEVRETQERK